MPLHPLAVLLGVATAVAQPPADPALNPVPTDSFLFVSAKVSKLWDHAAAKPVRDWLAAQKPGPLDQVIGLAPADIDRVTVFLPTTDAMRTGPLVLITTRKPYSEAAVLKALGVKPAAGRPATGRVVETESPFPVVAFLDDRSLLFFPRDHNEGAGQSGFVAQLITRKPDGPLAAALLSAQQHDLAVGLDVRALADLVGNDRGLDKQFVPYLSLLSAKHATLTADFDKTAKIQLTLAFADPATAKRAGPVLEEGIKAVAELITREAARPGGTDPVAMAMFTWANSVLKNAKVTVIGANAVATADVPYQDDLAKFVAVLPKSIAVARNEAKAKSNLLQLGLGMHAFHDANNTFPGDAGPGPKPPAWSWRVQILPFLEEDALFKKLDFNKPWDDPANLKILEAAEMPKVFELPGRAAPKGHTYFRVLSLPKNAKGFDRPFFKEGERGPRLAEVTDGLSNTVMVVEAGEAVPWYKPDVLAYDGKLPLPALGDKGADRLLVLMGDGSVQSLRPSKIDEKTLRALITIAGGEVVRFPD